LVALGVSEQAPSTAGERRQMRLYQVCDKNNSRLIAAANNMSIRTKGRFLLTLSAPRSKRSGMTRTPNVNSGVPALRGPCVGIQQTLCHPAADVSARPLGVGRIEVAVLGTLRTIGGASRRLKPSNNSATFTGLQAIRQSSCLGAGRRRNEATSAHARSINAASA
jgi:hypothetical protein